MARKEEKYFGMSPRIAKWKNNTVLENWLSYKADDSGFFRSVYLLYYKLQDRKYYNAGLNFIGKLIDKHKDLQEVPRKELVNDMIYCLHRFGISFENYQMYNFKEKNTYCRDTFISDKLRYHYADLLNGKGIYELLKDKLKCYEAYKEFYGREVVGCYTIDDYSRFEALLKKTNYEFIFKPIAGCCGKGVEHVKLKPAEVEHYFKKMIKDGSFVAEELIKQGKELSDIHPQSTNTLRVSTFVIGNKVYINSVFLRMGKGQSIVDNASGGGIFAGVDIERGIVNTCAKEFSSIVNYNYHPDTHVQIVGLKLPQWDNLLKMVNTMALKVKGTTLVGWDLAYTDKGWIMVEGNNDGAFESIQMLNDGLKPLLFSRMDEYFAYQKQLN